MNKIVVDGKIFADEFGRQRIFNGVNYCDKGDFNGWGVPRTFVKNTEYIFILTYIRICMADPVTRVTVHLYGLV